MKEKYMELQDLSEAMLEENRKKVKDIVNSIVNR